MEPIFNFSVVKQDGTVIDLYRDKNLWTSLFKIPSLPPRNVTEEIEGQHGHVNMGTTFGIRIATATIQIEANDAIDLEKKKDIVCEIFNPLEELYVIRDLQPNKRIPVRVVNQIDPEYITLEDAEFTVEFEMLFIESLYSTLETTEFAAQLSGPGTKEVKYKHSVASFEILNNGHIAINPRNMPLKISFTGESVDLSIKNLTTGDEWVYNDATNAGDIILLDGVRSTKNGLSVFRDTNKNLIRLSPGWNSFEITGASGSFELTFDFRFLYL